MKLDRYYFVSTDQLRVIVPKEGEKYCLRGKVYGHPEFKDGTMVRISSIVSIENEVATTRSGAKVELVSMHPDYSEILEAIKEEIPVIDDWSLQGNSEEGYIIDGWVGNVRVSGKVTEQEGNYVILNNMRYLVLWKNIHLEGEELLAYEVENRVCDLYLELDFHEYMDTPYLVPELVGFLI